MSTILRRSTRIAEKNAAKSLSPFLQQLKNMVNEANNSNIENTTERIHFISNVFEFMYDDRLKNVFATQTKFREETKRKINELDEDIKDTVIPYLLAMKYHKASKNLKNYIEEIEKSL